MRRAVLSFLLLFAGPLLAQTPVQGKRAFEARDWAAMRVAHTVAVSPDSNLILYEVNHGAEKGSTQSEWWLLDRDEGGRRKLSLPKDFSPSGFVAGGDMLYGTWQVGGASQFATFQLQGVTSESVPRTVVLLPRGVKEATPSPDGARFALTYDPRPPDPLAEVRTVVQPDSTGVYVVRSDGTGGIRWCVSLSHIADLAWSPDSRSLAAISSTPKIGFHDVTSFVDVCSEAGSRRVVEKPTPISSIAWFGAGDKLAFLSTSTHVLTPDHVWTVPANGGTAADRTPDLAGSATQLIADPQGEVWVSVQRGVRQEVDSFRDEKLKLAYQWPDGDVGLPVFSPYTGRSTPLAFTVDDPKHTSNVALATSGALRKVTNEGDDVLAALALADMRVFHWKNKEGIALEGLATFPGDDQLHRSRPLLVMPHGGPEANDTLALDPLAQIFAAHGYVVLQPEYRGSTGYGSDFLEAIYQHFGDRAYEDVDSATTFAIEQGWADPSRLAIFGWSAGGFMAAWTVTQTSRYKAAIEGAGITEWSSFMVTSDLVQTDFDERWPAETPEAFRKFSAMDFTSKVTTPLLILHGAADARVPAYQGLELFQTLAARGKTVRMVTYPGSPHFPVLWQQRLNIVSEVSDWLAKYNR